MRRDALRQIQQTFESSAPDRQQLKVWLTRAAERFGQCDDLPLPHHLSQTSEQADLFQLIQVCASRSEFVRSVANKQLVSLLDALQWHWQQPEAAYLAYLEQQLGEAHDDLDLLSVKLRRLRYVQAAALACLNFCGLMPVNRCSLRMSLLAEGIICAAYQGALAAISKRHGVVTDEAGKNNHLLILAMGKLGSYELNFSSDIDLIFFYQEGAESEARGEVKIRPLERQRYWQKVATELIRLLNAPTAEGFCFRTDMRLRPYGDSGALVMSLAQAEDYYQEQGRDWERYAMIRSRCLTGNENERLRLEQIIRPFTFRRYIDFGVLESIREMKAMIEREVRIKDLHDNIKLGAGGIREVEFVVQALQLIKGGREQELQQSHLLVVLPLLVDKGLLQPEVAEQLASAFLFLRRLEDLIQALDERHSQNLPTQAEEQASLAFAMGYSDFDELGAALQQIRQQVRSIFADLLHEPERKTVAVPDWCVSLWQTGLNAQDLAAHTGLDSDDCTLILGALDEFREARTTLALSQRGQKRLHHFMPLLLKAWATGTPSVETMRRLLTILRAVMRRTAYLELLAENPPVLQQLVYLAEKSDWVVDRLAAYPILFDELLYPSRLFKPLEESALADELRQLMLRIDTDDEEQQMNQLRSFKQTNELRIAAAMLSNKMDVSEVSRYLTLLAQSLLQAALNIAWHQVGRKYGSPPGLVGEDKGFAILGYGKLGGDELSFSSDLDIVFLFNQPVQIMTEGGERALEAGRFYTRLAQRLIHILSTRTHLGILYEVDTRLRPSGNSGLLVSHIDAYRDYQLHDAWTWEHQALVRARVVVGDPAIRSAFSELRFSVLSQCATKRKSIYAEVLKMRDKMRQQLYKPAQGIDLKQMPGGMVDIEFLAQLYALTTAQNNLPTRTVSLLQSMQATKWLSAEDCQLLIEHYRALRDEHNWHTVTGQWSSVETEARLSANCKRVEKIWQQVFADTDKNGEHHGTSSN